MPKPRRSIVGGLDLVGRGAEIETLRAAIDAAAAGEGRAVIVEGEPGIGKTRLIQEATAVALEQRFQVLSGAALELEHRRPFGAIAAMLDLTPDSPDERRAILGRLLRGGGDGSPLPVLAHSAELEFRVLEAIDELIQELAARGPTLLTVDDLHWADTSTLLVVHRLVRRLADLQTLLVVGVRRGPLSPQLERILWDLGEHGATRMMLGPLSDDLVEALAGGLLGAPPGEKLRKLLEGSGGNPFFVHELMRTLQRDKALKPVAAGALDVERVALPAALPLVILHRLSFLSRDTLGILRVASVLGSEFPVEHLALLLSRSAASLTQPIDECLRGGVLEDRGDRLAFRHGLIHEALYRDLTPNVRRAIHADAARALAAAGSSPVDFSEHVVRSATPGDARAVEWLQSAARDAASAAPTVAADLLERALEVAGPAHPDRASLSADRIVALWWSGRLTEAEALCRDALASPGANALEGAFRLSLAQILAAGGRVSEALAEIDASLDSPSTSDAERVRFRAWGAWCRMYSGDIEAAEGESEEALAWAEKRSDDLATCIALATLGSVANFRGRFDAALGHIDRAVTIAARSATREPHRFPLHLFRGAFLIELDRFDEASAALEEARRVVVELGVRWILPRYHWILGLERYWAGRWDDALAEIEAARALADEIGARPGSTYTYSIRALIALHRGSRPAAEASLADAEREFAATGRQHRADWMLLARALAQETSGDAAAAFETLGIAWDQCASAGIVSEYPVLGPDLVRLALAMDDHRRAAAVTEAVEDVAAQNAGAPSVAGAALLCRGLVEEDPKTLVSSVEAYRRGARPLDTAIACEHAAAALGSHAPHDEAVALFEEALALYGSLGASADERRIEARARSSGIRIGTRKRKPRPVSGWGALTDSERRVVDLAAEGLSDPEIARRLFLSRHTVHTHVSHALAKLGLRSKMQLAAAAAARRASQTPP